MLVILHCSSFSQSIDHLEYSEYKADLLFSIENKYILWLCLAWSKHVLSSFFVNLNEMDTEQLRGSKQYWSIRPCKTELVLWRFSKEKARFCVFVIEIGLYLLLHLPFLFQNKFHLHFSF